MKKYTLPLALLFGAVTLVSCDSKEAAQEKLIKSGVIHSVLDINNPEGQAAFLEAVRQKNEDIVEAFVKAGLNLKTTAVADAMQLSIEQSDFDTFKLLRKAGASLDNYGSSGTPLLETAVWTGNMKLMETLLSDKADVNVTDCRGWTPLMLLCGANSPLWLREGEQSPAADGRLTERLSHKNSNEAKQLEIMDILLKAGANVDYQSYIDHWSPLSVAAFYGRADMVQRLLDRGAQANIQPGRIPLAVAVLSGNEKIVRMLLQKGADPNAADDRFGLPLSIALAAENETMVQILLKAGANPNICGKQHPYPLAAAVEKGSTLLVDLLFQHGAISNIVDEKLGTPLYIAVKDNNVELAELLLKNGAKPTSGLKEDILAAALEHNSYILKLLVENGAKSSNKDLLLKAINTGSADEAESLLKAGIPIDTTDEKNRNFMILLIKRYIDAANNKTLLPFTTEDFKEYIEVFKRMGYSPENSPTSGIHNYIYFTIFATSGANANKVDCLPPVRLLLDEGFPIVTDETDAFLTVFNCIIDQVALHKGDELFRLLMEHNININGRAKNGLTLLEVAFSREKYDMAQCLIDKGCDKMACSDNSKPLLHLMAEANNLQAVEMLLKAGVKVNKKDSLKRTVLDSVRLTPSMRELLLRYGAKKSHP